jgi:hypothetical protein
MLEQIACQPLTIHCLCPPIRHLCIEVTLAEVRTRCWTYRFSFCRIQCLRSQIQPFIIHALCRRIRHLCMEYSRSDIRTRFWTCRLVFCRVRCPRSELEALLSGQPNELVGEIHTRVLVVLPPETLDRWLTGKKIWLPFPAEAIKIAAR